MLVDRMPQRDGDAAQQDGVENVAGVGGAVVRDENGPAPAPANGGPGFI